jgi:quinol monooxygenase YgiN
LELFLFACFHARTDQADAVMQTLIDVLAPTRMERGCLSIHAYRSIRDPLEFYIHSRWKDRAAFDHHGTLPHTVQFVSRMTSLIDHPFKVTLADEIG